MPITPIKASLAAAASAVVIIAGTATAAIATSGPVVVPPVQVTPGPTASAPATATSPAPSRDEPLVYAFEQVTQNTQWTLSKTIPQTYIPAGHSWENEGFKYYGGRFYISADDITAGDGHLIILNSDGDLIKDIAYVDGDRNHSGGLSVYGDYAYVPLAVNAAHSSADILQINVKTYQIKTLFTVPFDHVGGIMYDPATNLIVGQDWDSRTFYEWTLTGKQVATWTNPSDYVGYQDCQYVVYNKMLCSGATVGNTTLGGFDLIDLSDPEHAILNGVPSNRAGNANEILATPLSDGTELTDYDAQSGAIQEYTTIIPKPGRGPVPTVTVPEGTPAIDDQAGSVWSKSPVLSFSSPSSAISATVQMLWDSKYIYFLAHVSDATPVDNVTTDGLPDNADIGGLEDSVDVWINWTNSSTASYYIGGGTLASHYVFTRNGIVGTNFPLIIPTPTTTWPWPPSSGYGTSDPSTVKSDVTSTATGYVVEAAIPWPSSLGPQPQIGINFDANDFTTPGGPRASYITWDTNTIDSFYWDSPNGLPGITLAKS